MNQGRNLRKGSQVTKSTSIRTQLLLGGALGAAVLLAGCGGSNSSASTSAGGAAKFQAVCAKCHGPKGKGMPELGKDITTSAFVASQTDEQLVAFIKEGRLADHSDNTTGVAMPPKGGDPTISNAQVQQIVDFVRSIQIEAP